MKKIVVVDAGHGGTDHGGRSLGTPEKTLALRYALELGTALQARGVAIVYTRVADTYPSLSERAQVANEARADLFVSVHANASDRASARGPWTIHAKGSNRGEDFATAAQGAMVAVMGGNRAAVYPDESPWVGGRRLAVLRQTRMPAILLELGFMTNAADLRLMEDAVVRSDLCRRVAAALAEELGVVSISRSEPHPSFPADIEVGIIPGVVPPPKPPPPPPPPPRVLIRENSERERPADEPPPPSLWRRLRDFFRRAA